ncbi:hypothetical protein Trydic_g18372 [Trypoxylus dichotomus]
MTMTEEELFIRVMDESRMLCDKSVKSTDSTINTSRQAFLQDLSTSLAPLKGREQQYVLTHAGNEKGFIPSTEDSFLCKRNTLYTQFYNNIIPNLPNLPAHSVIILDNSCV